MNRKLWRRVVIGLGLAGCTVGVVFAIRFNRHIDRVATRLTLESGHQATQLLDAADEPIGVLFRENRIDVPLDDVSPHLIHAVLAAEDRRFFDHGAIDVRRMIAAAIVNVRAGRIRQGASTISQQLARMTALDRSRTYRRKVKEVALANRLEQQATKRAILEAYLNRIYLGDGYHGVETAAQGYFHKSAAELQPAEAAMLAALIRAPSVYSPRRTPERLRARRDWVLGEMQEQGWLDRSQYAEALAAPLHTPATESETEEAGLYFKDAVARELFARFGVDRVLQGGLRVYTTMDREMQQLADDVVRQRVREVAPRDAWAGERPNPLQGALVAMDPHTGEVRALVGGRSFGESRFNRALAAKRQPGSAFKPLIWASALELGQGPGTLLRAIDQPIEADRGLYLPAGEHEAEELTLRQALVVSSNRAAVHLLQRVGTRFALGMARQLGIEERLPAVPAVALGTGEVTLLQLTTAYAAFADGGVAREPTLIRRVEDGMGNVLYRASPVGRKVLRDSTAFLMADMLGDAINRGTGHGVRRGGFKQPAGGKTGTSSDYADAWFIGFTPHLATGVWFGHDRPRPIGRRAFAAVVAVPAWAQFMKEAVKDDPPDWFDPPPSVVRVELCRETGQLATEGCHAVRSEAELVSLDGVWTSVPATDAATDTDPPVYEDWVDILFMPQPCELHGWPVTEPEEGVEPYSTAASSVKLSRL